MKLVTYGPSPVASASTDRIAVTFLQAVRAKAAQLRRATRLIFALSLASLFFPAVVSAQAAVFPSKPLKFIAPASPGGAGDTLSRILAKEMEGIVKQPIVVENKPGAGSTIGYNLLARSPADGYSLGVISVTNIAIAGASKNFKNIASLQTDLIPLGGVATTPHLLVISKLMPVNTVPELIALLKKEPGQYNFASQGQGSVSHLEGELFKKVAGVDMVHIPYQGSAPALLSLISGSTQIMFDSPAPVLPHIKSGALRVLAIAGTQRSAQFPDVPTLAELGMTSFQADNQLGLFVPAKTPAEVVKTLSHALEVAMSSPETQQTLRQVGLTPHYLSGSALKKVVDDDMALWPPIVQSVESEDIGK